MSKLPSNEIGISDILAYRECPQRWVFDMRRHLPMPDRFKLEEGEKADPSGRESYAASYGSAIHDAIEVVENTQCSDEAAIDAVWPVWQHWLEPGDADRMKADLETYRTRSVTGYRLIGTELELRAPLFVHEGEVIYFRGRIDVLYQHLQNAGIYLSRDYKSSRWPKTEQEVREDPQQWAYNWLIHETHVDCQTLVQQYDQLRYGVIPVQKNDEQRGQIKAWLIRQVKAILADDLYKPKQNQWCYTCPLMPDCRVTHLSPDFWINRLGALAPEKKVGRKLVTELAVEHHGIETYTKLLPQVKNARKVMERFEEAVESVLKEMPDADRAELGYGLTKPAQIDTWDADAKRKLAAALGDDFFHLVSLSKKAVADFYGDGTPEYEAVVAQAVKKQQAPKLKAPKG